MGKKQKTKKKTLKKRITTQLYTNCTLLLNTHHDTDAETLTALPPTRQTTLDPSRFHKHKTAPHHQPSHNMSSRTTRGTQKTLAVGVIRDFFRESPLPDTNEFIEEFVMRHSYTYEYPDTPQGQRMWQQYHGDKINKEARQAILAKFGGKRGPVKSDPADDVAEDAQGEAVETAAATEEDESPATKEFVTQGEYADTDSDASDGHFSLPLPVDQDVLNTNKDFQLPWNIYCPTGNVKPKSWKSIKRSEYEFRY